MAKNKKAQHKGPRRRGKGGRKAALTDRQITAINAYFQNDFKKIDAMRTAGYANPANQIGRFFANPTVIAEIERRRSKLTRKFEVSQERVLREMQAIAFARLSDMLEIQDDGTAVLDFRKLNDDQAAALAEFTVDEYMEGRGDMAREVKKTRIKFHDKKGALDSLARHLGLFQDKATLEAGESLVELLQRGRDRVKKTPEPEEPKGE